MGMAHGPRHKAQGKENEGGRVCSTLKSYTLYREPCAVKILHHEIRMLRYALCSMLCARKPRPRTQKSLDINTLIKAVRTI